MPLEKGRSKAVMSHNIAEMVNAGHPLNQAVAAAYHEKRISDSVIPSYAKPAKQVGSSRDAARTSSRDALRRAISAGERELEAQRQAKALLEDRRYVGGADRAKIRTRRG